MNLLNRKSLFAKLVSVAGIVGVSSSIAVPGFAELNHQTHGFKSSGDRVFELADNAPQDRTSPRSPATDPSNNNNPGRSSDTPTTPSNNNNPGRSSDTPTGGETSPNSLSSRDSNFCDASSSNWYAGSAARQVGRAARF